MKYLIPLILIMASCSTVQTIDTTKTYCLTATDYLKFKRQIDYYRGIDADIGELTPYLYPICEADTIES